MARKVKCQITGEYGTSDIFIKINGKYYKSRQIYDDAMREKEYRNKVIDIIVNELLGYETGQPYPSIVNKKLVELKFYKYEIIYRTLSSLKNNLIYMMGKRDFRNDYDATAYIFAAIKNNINDVYKDSKRESKTIESASKTSELDGFADFEIVEQSNIKKKVNNISEFI